MAKKTSQPTYEEAVQRFRDNGFDLIEAPGVANRVFLKKNNCSAAIEKAADGAVKIFAYPGYMSGGEISKLVNRGYQQFFKTTKAEVPATADKLTALNGFVAEFKQALGLPNLYNEALGTTSEGYVYDRLVGRDLPPAKRPERPWQAKRAKKAEGKP
jgi:hypothetical protein